MGVEEQTIEQALVKLKFIFKFTGLKLHDVTKPSRMNFLFNFIWLQLDLSATMLHAVNTSDPLEKIFLTPCLAFTAVGVFKAICYKIDYSKIHLLIDDMIQLGRYETIYLEIARDIKLVEINFLNKVTKVFIGLTYMMISVFNLGPLLLIAVTYFTTKEVHLFLPFLNIYPFDTLVWKYWPFAYAHQFWSVVVAISYASSMDCILFMCCTYLRIQFRVLQADVKNLIPIDSIRQGKFKGNINFQTQFKEILKRHQEVIRITKALENIFSSSILLNFISSSIVICLTGFNIIVMEGDPTLEITFIIFLAMGLLQVWCLCYFGELLMNSSQEVSDAFYECKWYLATRDIAKQLLFLQARAQKPCKLTALGFADVNLNAFMQVLSKAWSFFALLNTIYTR